MGHRAEVRGALSTVPPAGEPGRTHRRNELIGALKSSHDKRRTISYRITILFPETTVPSLRSAIAFAFPLVLASAAGAQIPKSVLVDVVETHKASVLRYLDAAPDSMMNFRPTPGVRTFAEQIEHAAQADVFIAHMAITGNMNMPNLGDSAVYRHNKAALRTYVVAAMDHTLGMLRGVTDASLSQPITMMQMTKPRYRFLVELLDHFPWTLGQTVPYLRMNGVTPPMYTPF